MDPSYGSNELTYVIVSAESYVKTGKEDDTKVLLEKAIPDKVIVTSKPVPTLQTID